MSDIGLTDAEQSDIASSGLSSGVPDMGSDYDSASFDEAYSPDDFTSGEMNFASAIGRQTGGFGDDNTAQTIANFIAQPQVGLNRSNISRTANFDPTFAAALDISRGLNPGVGSPLARPSYLSPQIPGEFMTADYGEADMVRPMFNSQLERILQQTIPEAIKEGPVARIATGIGNFFGNIFSEGRDFAKDSEAGVTLPSLLSEGFTNFMNRFKPADRDTQTGRPIEPRGTELGDMTTTNARIPDARVVVDDFNRPLARTVAPIFPSDMNQVPMLGVGNTGGITTTRPNMAQEADMEVAEALQLIPSNLETNPIAPISKVQITDPTGVFSALPTTRDREKRDFARDVFQAFPAQRERQFGRVDPLSTINQDYFNRVRNKEPFKDEGNFINLDNIVYN